MDKILSVVGGVPSQVGRNDDDMADRLSYRYTSLILVVFSLIVSRSQYVGNPINCWVPAHFTGNHEEYANNYCWIKSTYYLPFEEYIPYEHEEDKRYMISYYQWVPLILLVQAMFFYLPCMLWRSLNMRSGIDVNELVETAEVLQAGQDDTDQEKTLDKIASQARRYYDNIHNYFAAINHDDPDQRLPSPACMPVRTRSGQYLVILYLVCKFFYFANMIGQLFLMDRILGSDYHMYGINVLLALMRGEDWRSPERFPRTTMCDLKIRRLGNVHRYTVQCVLPINLFNEMIFLFVWWWTTILAAYTAWTFLAWLIRLLAPKEDERFIKKHLMYRGKDIADEDLVKFKNWLRKDGVFVMRLIGINTDAVTVTDIVCALWDKFHGTPDDVSQASTSTAKH